MNQHLSQAISLLETGERRNRAFLIGTGAFLMLLGLLALLFLDPAELGRKAYFGRFLLPVIGAGTMALPFVRKNKVLEVLRSRPQHVTRWSIEPRGQGLPLVLQLDDGSTVTRDLNVHVAKQLKQLLPHALPNAK